MLKLGNVSTGYGDAQVLHDVSMEIKEGQIVALIGANGAGKTTTLNAISGLLPLWDGHITFQDQAIHNIPPHKIVNTGLIQVPEGRRLFPEMTVLENLELGSFRRGKPQRGESLSRIFSLFPRLEERRTQRAGTLSGGEQQMLAIGRAMMTLPRLLVLDEPSLGLAPLIVKDIFDVIATLRESGITILIVEQNAVQALDMADQGYVMENGHIVLSGTGTELLENEEIRTAYLGL